MRVRCDKCGTKALLAASQCPHCGHLLQVRDGFGELLPLAHCPTCDSHYPLRQGECRWCGTKPEVRRVGPYAWRGVGLLAIVGVGWVTWFSSRGTREDVATSQSPAPIQTASRTTLVDSGVASETVASADSAIMIHEAVPTSVAAADTMAPESAGRDTTPPSAGASELAPVLTPTLAEVRTRSSSKASAQPRRNGRWVGAVAHQWVTVRAAAAHSARFVASIGPDTRVQLGEARGAWMRIRTKGISGWVERTQF